MKKALSLEVDLSFSNLTHQLRIFVTAFFEECYATPHLWLTVPHQHAITNLHSCGSTHEIVLMLQIRCKKNISKPSIITEVHAKSYSCVKSDVKTSLSYSHFTRFS